MTLTRRGFLGAVTGLIVGSKVPKQKPSKKPATQSHKPLVLTKQEWMSIDACVIKAARERLRTWTDLTIMNKYALLTTGDNDTKNPEGKSTEPYSLVQSTNWQRSSSSKLEDCLTRSVKENLSSTVVVDMAVYSL